LTQKCLQKISKIYGKRHIVFQYPSVLYQKFKVLFGGSVSILPWSHLLKGTTLVLLVLLIFYCGHQHRQLNQMVSINTSLRNTIYTQHGTLSEQEQEIMAQMLKSQAQEDALMEEILTIGELTHRFQSMAEDQLP